MPDVRDIAALPTSWALTIWDALPIFLSIELALALIVVNLLASRVRNPAWSLTSRYFIGGFVYLALFDVSLAATFAVAALALAGISLRASPSATSPDSPVSALWNRGGDVLWDVAKASLAAAIIKTLLGPWLGSGNALWLPIAIAGPVVTAVPFGASAIPTLAIETSADSLAPVAVWILVAATRPHLLRLARGRWRSGSAAEEAS